MPSILLADANPTNRRIVELSFDDEPIEVISFGDGLKARDYLADNGVDVVLADVALPSIDGYELCRLVKQRPDLEHVPVVLMAGRFQMVDLERAEEAGYHSQINKPVEPASLVDLVKDLLSKAETAAESAAPPQSASGEGQNALSTKPESVMVFQIPLMNDPHNRVFTLKTSQCRPSAEVLRRDAPAEEMPEAGPEPAPQDQPAVPSPPPVSQPVEETGAEADSEVTEEERRDPDEVDRVVKRLAGKLPDLVRAILEEERGGKN